MTENIGQLESTIIFFLMFCLVTSSASTGLETIQSVIHVSDNAQRMSQQKVERTNKKYLFLRSLWGLVGSNGLRN